MKFLRRIMVIPLKVQLQVCWLPLIIFRVS
jgi:hypothetical protein